MIPLGYRNSQKGTDGILGTNDDFSDTSRISNGFFVSDPDTPETTLTASLEAFAEVNGGIAAAGVGGGIFANIGFDLKDPTPGDKKVRLTELEQLLSNPLTLFDTYGELTAGLSAYLQLGIDPFSYTKRLDSPRVTLLNFNQGGNATSPKLTLAKDIGGGVIELNMGLKAADRLTGNTNDEAEVFIIQHESGSVGNEKILVSAFNDTTAYTVGSKIVANGGEQNDIIELKGNNEGVLSPAELAGGNGNDWLIGGGGDDWLSGDNEWDRLYGGGGSDTLSGGTDNDWLVGGAGADVLNGGEGFDIASYDVSASTGVLVNLTTGEKAGDATGDVYECIEQLDGSPYADTLIGSLQNDVISGGDGNDLIGGEAGDDILLPDLGSFDWVDGGAGNDLLIVDYSVTDTGQGVISSVNDSFSDGASGSFGRYQPNIGSTDYVAFSAIENFQVTGTSQNDIIHGGRNNDTLIGGVGNDTLTSGDGIDTVDGGTDTDVLTDANFSASTVGLVIDNSGAAITLSNGISVTSIEKFPNLTTGSGNDSITFGERYNESIKTGAGDDIIDPGLGSFDSVDGEAGNDLLIVDYSVADTGQGVISSVNDFSDGASGSFGRYQANIGSTDYVGFNSIENFQVTGTSQNDIIHGGRNNDTLIGGVGNDTITSGDGIDTVDGGTDTDVLTDANFSASTVGLVIDNSGAAITLSNGISVTSIEKFPNLTTGSGNDSITFGERYNESIKTGAGDDIIDPGLGSFDSVDGEAGNDLLIVDYSVADTGQGVISSVNDSFSDGASGSFARYQANIGSTDYVAFSAIENFQVTGTSQNDIIHGGRNNDTLIGGVGNDTITSGDGIDIVDGGTDTDVLTDANFSASTVGLVIDNSGAAITLSNGISVTSIEKFPNLTTGSGNDSITFGERYNESIKTGAGDDIIDPGLGSFDSVDGEAGNDLLIVDYSVADTGQGVISSVNDSFSDGASGSFARYQANIGSTDYVAFSALRTSR
jgi:Ca2+-binding RTX toxin-like protein